MRKRAPGLARWVCPRLPGPRLPVVDGMVYLNVRVPRGLHHRLRVLCVERDITVATVIQAACEEKLRAG